MRPAPDAPTTSALRPARRDDRDDRDDRRQREDLARRLFFVLVLFAAVLAASVLIPFVFSQEYFRDGAYIVGIPGSAGEGADSYERTAYVLAPVFALLQAAGIDLGSYGVVFDLDMLLTNTVFGVIGFVFVAGVLLAYRLPERFGWEAVRIVAVVVLLGPFVFSISKETIALVVCGVVLLVARAQRWPTWATCLVWAVALASLQWLRAYYPVIALLFVLGYFFARSPRKVLLFYAGFLAALVVAYPFLPLDDITAGRAEALADVSGSRISYPVDDTNAVGFMLSRTYAFVSLLVPVELAVRSVVYLPYVVLQLMMTWRIVQVVRSHATGLQLLAVHVVLSFTVVGALYEPDYGSYFRHKIGTLLFLLILMSGTVLRRRATPPAEVRGAPATSLEATAADPPDPRRGFEARSARTSADVRGRQRARRR